jgi:hypothetical protein
MLSYNLVTFCLMVMGLMLCHLKIFFRLLHAVSFALYFRHSIIPLTSVLEAMFVYLLMYKSKSLRDGNGMSGSGINPKPRFYTRDVLWYSVVRLSVCPSVCLSGPCRQDRDWTVSSRIIQLGILDHHHERKNPIVFQGQRSKVKIVALLSRKTL